MALAALKGSIVASGGAPPADAEPAAAPLVATSTEEEEEPAEETETLAPALALLRLLLRRCTRWCRYSTLLE